MVTVMSGGSSSAGFVSCVYPLVPGVLLNEIFQGSILDLPPSWVRKLTLDRDRTALRYPPKGRRTIFYRRAKAELFAENVHHEGTTLRLTLYKVREDTKGDCMVCILECGYKLKIVVNAENVKTNTIMFEVSAIGFAAG